MNVPTLQYRDARAGALVVPRGDARLIEDEARKLARDRAGASLHDEELLLAIELATAGLSGGLRRRLLEFRDHGNDDGTLLLRGMPLGQVPPTPTGRPAGYRWTDLPVPTVGQLMVMSLLGRAVSYIDEKQGHLVQDICPQPGAEDRQENSGSALLELHTEDGFHPHQPHFLSLLCLRGDRGGEAVTVSGSLRAVLGDLDEATTARLRRPEYRIRFSSSFTGSRTADSYSPAMPVLGADGELQVDFHASEGLTAAATAALGRLREAVLDRLVGVVLEPGELLIVDNRLAVHGRSAFTPRYDGQDRWLRRSFVVADLRPVQPYLAEGRAHEAITVAGGRP